MADLINRIRIIATTEGADKAAADVGKLNAAITETDRKSKDPGLSARNSFENLRASADRTVKALRELEQAQQRISRYVAQPRADLAEAARIQLLVQQRYNAALSPSGPVQGPPDMRAKIAEDQAAAVARLRAEIDPLGAAQGKLNAQLAEYNALAKIGAISDEERAAASALANSRFAATTRTLDGLSRGTRVSTQTMQNMAFQLNDIAVMSASGQNFGVMAMQQGMQLAQGFEQAGVKGTGALKLLGLGVAQFLTNPLYIAVAAIAAVGEGVHLLASAFKSSIPPLNEVLKTHDDLLKSIKEGYSDAANAAVAFSTRSQSALLAMTDRQRVLEEFHLQATGKSLADTLTSGTTVVASQQISGVPKELLQIRDAVDLYSASVEKGAPKAAELFESLLKIERTTADQNIKQFAVSILQSIQPVADLEEGLRNLNVAATRASALRVAAQQVDPATLNPDRGTNTLYLERLRQANELNAVSARSPGQLAAVAAERERISLIGERMSTEERAERIAMADIRARAQAEYAINEALRQRQTSRLDEESSSQIELMTIGKSVQAATAMRYEFQQLTESKNAAYQATGKYIVSPDEVRAIRDAADAMGELAKKSAEAKIQDDLRFQNEQLYRNAMDREVAAQLHGAGLAQDDPVGIDIRRNLELQKTVQYMDQWRDASTQVLDDLLQGKNALQDIGQLLLHMGEKELIKGLFGEQGQAGGGLFGGLLQQIMHPLAGSTPANPVAARTIAAAGGGIPIPLGLVTSRDIPPLPGGLPNGMSGALSGNQKLVYDYFAQKGLGPHALSGMMGNVQVESGFNPAALEKGGGGIGLFQMTGPRADELRTAVPDWATNPKGQMDFAWGEMTGPEKKHLLDLLNAQDAPTATAAFGGFERPKGYDPLHPELMSNWSDRLTAAQGFDTQFQQSGQKIAQGLDTTAKTVQQSANSFVPQFNSGLNSILNSLGAGGGLSPLALLGISGGSAGGGFAGLYAVGGSIPAGKWGIVGERGPERVWGPATVSPHAGGGDVHHHVTMGDTVINIDGSADERTVMMIRSEMAANNAKQRKEWERTFGAVSRNYSDMRG